MRPKPDQRALYYQLMDGLYDAILILDDRGHVVDVTDGSRVLATEETWYVGEKVIPGMSDVRDLGAPDQPSDFDRRAASARTAPLRVRSARWHDPRIQRGSRPQCGRLAMDEMRRGRCFLKLRFRPLCAISTAHQVNPALGVRSRMSDKPSGALCGPAARCRQPLPAGSMRR